MAAAPVKALVMEAIQITLSDFSPPAAPSKIVPLASAAVAATPGIIDVHSHLGVYASPGTNAAGDGNEAVAPNTAEVWAILVCSVKLPSIASPG